MSAPHTAPTGVVIGSKPHGPDFSYAWFQAAGDTNSAHKIKKAGGGNFVVVWWLKGGKGLFGDEKNGGNGFTAEFYIT